MSTEIEYRIERLRSEATSRHTAAAAEHPGLRRVIGRALIAAGRTLQGLDAREAVDAGRRPMAGHA